MTQSDHLLAVIRSLSKSERRYFKLQSAMQKGSKIYLELFEILEESKPDDSTQKKTFLKKFPGKAYDASRKHLYKILMRSLRSYETHKTTEDKLISLIADVKILLNKGLLDAGFSEIARGKKIALKYEKFFYYLILARMELQHLTLTEFPNVDESKLLEKQEKITSLLYEELYIHKHASLYEIIVHRYIHQGMMRSDGEREKLNDLLLEEFQVNANQRYHNFQTDKLHLHFQSAYFLMTGEANLSLQEFYKLNLLFEQHREHWADDPLYYIYLVNGILSNLRAAGEYSEMKVFINRLQELEINSAGMQRLVQHLAYHHSAAILIDHGQFEEGLDLLARFERRGGMSANVPLNILATTLLTSAILFFGTANYRKALIHVNEALSLPEHYISRHTYVVSRTLLLIIHLELGNEDLLAYAIKSFERKLKSTKILYQAEKVTLDFLKKRISALKSAQKENDLQYELQLAAILHDKNESPVLKTFDLLAWIRSKINRVSFSDQIKNSQTTGRK